MLDSIYNNKKNEKTLKNFHEIIIHVIKILRMLLDLECIDVLIKYIDLSDENK